MNTDKHWIRNLVEICARKGLTKVVLSPGSRCAPLVIAFSRHPDIECISIIDERSAAFFALGIAQQLKQPVGLVCTSGTAGLNYAPALAEAYYQRIPLVAFTADRPKEWIDQADGQTIRQYEMFRNFVRSSYEIPYNVTETDDTWYSDRVVSEALNTALAPVVGPVHINCPFREPLYRLQAYDEPASPRVIEPLPYQRSLDSREQQSLVNDWHNSIRKMVVVGSIDMNQGLKQTLQAIAKDTATIVLAEITSNLYGEGIIKCLDPALEAIPNDNKSAYQPDLLLTIGGTIISKKLKMFLRDHSPTEHWHVDVSGVHTDTYQSLTKLINISPEELLPIFSESAIDQQSNYHQLWQDADQKAQVEHRQIVQDAPYCDLTVWNELIKHLPENSELQLGNSTPVRYAALFNPKSYQAINIHSNRGTSGIDGTVSTAAGAAYANDIMTTVICGDISFFYDSNALWNKHLPGQLRIIIINNSGGNIFRIIRGPSELEELEDLFETKHDLSAQHFAKAFGLPYYFCQSISDIKRDIQEFYQPHDNKCVIMEIKTPNDISAEVLKNYLKISNNI